MYFYSEEREPASFALRFVGPVTQTTQRPEARHARWVHGACRTTLPGCQAQIEAALSSPAALENRQNLQDVDEEVHDGNEQ